MSLDPLASLNRDVQGTQIEWGCASLGGAISSETSQILWSFGPLWSHFIGNINHSSLEYVLQHAGAVD